MRVPRDRSDASSDPEPLAPEDAQLLELSRDLRRLAGHLLKDPAGADDVVQEAWLAALERPPGEVRTLAEWMRSVVRRLAQRRLRRERRRADVEALVAVRDEAEFDAEIDARLSTQRLLRTAVEEVSEPSRAVLLAHYFDGRTLESVAAQLQRPLETVRTQRRRGLAELRAALDRRHKGDRSAWAGLLVFVAGGAEPRRGPHRLALGATAALLVATTVFLAFEVAGDPARATSEPEVAAVTPNAPAATGDADRSAAADPGADSRERVEVAVVEPPAPPPASAPAPPAVPPRRLDVRVVDAAGLPVPDAIVSITASLELPDLPQQHTDEHGRTTVEVDAARLLGAPFFEPPAGGVSIRANAAGQAYSRTHHVPIPEGGAAIELVLGGPEQVFVFHVLDLDGRPVAGAFVEADKRRDAIHRGADGVSSTETPIGAYTDSDGWARLPHLVRREHEIDIRADGFVVWSMPIPTIEPLVTIEIRLDRGATLVGDVRRADGSLVADAEVFAPRAEFHREKPPGTRTGADGRFRLAGLQPGATRIFVRAPQPEDGRADAIVELPATGETTTSITLRARPDLRVRLQDVRSGSVAGMLVVLRSRPDSQPAWQTMALADAAGTCTFDAFPSEILECQISRGSEGHASQRLEIDARRPEDVLVQVDLGSDTPVATLTGTVLDARRAPLTGACVLEIRGDAFAEGRFLVDTVTGGFRSNLVATGLARWIVVAHEGVAELGVATVEQDAAIDLGTVHLQPPGRARIAPSSRFPSNARVVLRHRTHTATGVVEGRVRELWTVELERGLELELLPYEYIVRVLDASNVSRAEVTFRVTSASLVEVVLP